MKVCVAQCNILTAERCVGAIMTAGDCNPKRIAQTSHHAATAQGFKIINHHTSSSPAKDMGKGSQESTVVGFAAYRKLAQAIRQVHARPKCSIAILHMHCAPANCADPSHTGSPTKYTFIYKRRIWWCDAGCPHLVYYEICIQCAVQRQSSEAAIRPMSKNTR